MLACCMLQYKQLEHLLAMLTDMLNKEEHMAVVCAELAEFVAKQLGSNQLVCSLCPLYIAVLIIPAFWAFAINSHQCNKLFLTSLSGYYTKAALIMLMEQTLHEVKSLFLSINCIVYWGNLSDSILIMH